MLSHCKPALSYNKAIDNGVLGGTIAPSKLLGNAKLISFSYIHYVISINSYDPNWIAPSIF